MPNHKSAIKRVKQAEKARDRNRSNRGTFRTALKAAELAIVEGDADKAAKDVQQALKVIGKTQKKGLIHPNKAARHASRLTKKLNKLSAPKS
jgi:small subunit ribosomal protein S20